MSGVTFLRKARLPSSWMCSSIRQKDDSSSFAFVGSISFRKLDFLGSLGLYECNEVYNATLLWTKLQMYKSPFSAYCILQTIAYIIWKAATICLFYEKNIFFRKLTVSTRLNSNVHAVCNEGIVLLVHAKSFEQLLILCEFLRRS